MQLTSEQKRLIRGLKIFGCDKNETVMVLLLADTPEKRQDLMEFMASNTKATPQDILEKLEQILHPESFQAGK